MATTTPTPFGRALRHWRTLRGVSQLDLASTAATTTRHVSYLETGRSRPSGEMVDRLGKALAIPLRDRNRLLELAGLAASYREGDLATDDLAPFRAAIDRLLDTHEPYPAYVVDRHWDVVETNRAAVDFLPGLDAPPADRLVLWSQYVANLPEVAPAFLDRIAADLHRYPDDERLRELHRAMSDVVPRGGPRDPGATRVLCPVFRIDGQEIRTLTVVARFESAVDVTLDELRVELIYPQDDVAETFFRHRAEASSTSAR